VTTAASPPGAPAAGRVDELLLRFARAAHRAGFPSDDLERRVEELGESLGRPVAVSATPTLIEVAIGAFPHQHSAAIRVTPHQVNLDLVGRLDDLAERVRTREAGVPDALDELDAMQPLRRPWPVSLAAYGLAGAAITPVLGGGPRESVAAAVVGFAVGAVVLLGTERRNGPAMVTPIAAIVASLGCALLTRAGLENAVDTATLAALVAVLPGMTLTIGMRELATNHLQSGVANTAVAAIQLVGLVFGVAVGTSVADRWFGAAPVAHASSFDDGIAILAAAIAGLAFTVTLQARRADAVWMCSAAVLARVVDELAAPLVGEQAAVFVAALAVGLAGNAFALVRRRSALVVIVPGVLMLVPGSLGFESASSLFANQTVAGIDAAFDAIVAALAIVYGLLVSASLIPERKRGPIEQET
jgi:uncharacterized membrane protein YjjP (DUF1212 family)